MVESPQSLQQFLGAAVAHQARQVRGAQKAVLGDVPDDRQIVVGQTQRLGRGPLEARAAAGQYGWREEGRHACILARDHQYSSAKLVTSWCAMVELGIAAAMCAR